MSLCSFEALEGLVSADFAKQVARGTPQQERQAKGCGTKAWPG
jgi:hypothetical protein